ncbi:MAG: putative peptidoglycan glycosyltransferase FtsW [Faecalimonas sp.]|nr:putative peptidoglycan glycosyltransferase FtsW [Faecalimonas sp.]
MGKQKKQGTNSIPYFDYSLLAIIIFLLCFGLVILYSTSSYSAQIKFKGDAMYYFRKQALSSVLSLVGMFVVSKIDYHIYAKVAYLAYGVAMVLMILVQTPLGIEAYGARRWIRLPFNQQMQPSEVMKLAIVILIPLLICKAGKHIREWKVFFKILAWGVVAAAGVYFFTDNLSTALIVLGMVVLMLFVAHPKTAPFVGVAVLGIAVLALGVRMLDSMMLEGGGFRLQRVLVWLHPEQYADEGGFQVLQGLYAIGSGGFFGKGLGNSAQKMIIPEVQNDMILSIVCEELGVFGAIVILTLFGMMLYRLMFIAQNAPDMYGSLIVTGIFAHIALQVFLNVAVVLNLIPTTGITLPFISYGGTSILFLMAEMGLALGVSARIRLEN